MKDEIKEILELFGSTDENIMFGDIVELNSKQSHLLLDYITNLQEEIERQSKAQVILDNQIADMQQNLWEEQELSELFKDKYEKMKEELQQEKKDFKETNDYCFELKDYKSRNEKANNILKDTSVDMPETLLIETIDYARHILNGGDEE